MMYPIYTVIIILVINLIFTAYMYYIFRKHNIIAEDEELGLTPVVVVVILIAYTVPLFNILTSIALVSTLRKLTYYNLKTMKLCSIAIDVHNKVTYLQVHECYFMLESFRYFKYVDTPDVEDLHLIPYYIPLGVYRLLSDLGTGKVKTSLEPTDDCIVDVECKTFKCSNSTSIIGSIQYIHKQTFNKGL